LAQANILEQALGEIQLIISIDCAEETLVKRLLFRGIKARASSLNSKARLPGGQTTTWRPSRPVSRFSRKIHWRC